MSHAADRIIDLLKNEGYLNKDDYTDLNERIRKEIDELQFVELHTAHMFDCENCGAENFCRAIQVETTEEVKEEYGDLEFYTSPNSVICKSCGKHYLVKYPNEELEDEII